MKTITGKIVSTKPVSLAKAATILSNFVSSDNGASQATAAYLERASAAFNELVCYKKHHKLKKRSSKEEASAISDISHRSLEEDEVKVLENGGLNKKFEQDSIDGKPRKKEKKRKKSEGSLGIGENENVEVDLKDCDEAMKEKNEEKKKKKKKRKSEEVDGGEVGNSVTPEKKKRRRTEADD